MESDGRREVLTIEHLATESRQGLELVFENLKQRSVERIDLVVSDALLGIELLVAKVFGSVAHQFCVIHLKRGVLTSVASKYKKEVAEELK